MGVREKILGDLNNIESQDQLCEIYDFIQHLTDKNNLAGQENRNPVIQLCGTISNDDAQEMIAIVSNEFSQIEGDW